MEKEEQFETSRLAEIERRRLVQEKAQRERQQQIDREEQAQQAERWGLDKIKPYLTIENALKTAAVVGGAGVVAYNLYNQPVEKKPVQEPAKKESVPVKKDPEQKMDGEVDVTQKDDVNKKDDKQKENIADKKIISKPSAKPGQSESEQADEKNKESQALLPAV